MYPGWLTGAAGVVSGGALALSAVAVWANVSAAIPVSAAVSQSPRLSAPQSGATLSNFNPDLRWALPPETTQYEIMVLPFGNDGPGIDLIANAATSFAIPPPPDWFVLLPDMTYSWKVRASDAAHSIGTDDPSWGPWSDVRTFRTPALVAAALTAVDPQPGGSVVGFQPTLIWETADPNIWYFEIQLSTDPNFQTDPETATAAVYWELKHANPDVSSVTPYSYTVPHEARLQAGATYYWRIRPRVQGDGAAAPWGPNNRFTTPAPDAMYLDVFTPMDETVAAHSTITVRGNAKADSIVSVVGNDTLEQVVVGRDGNFSVVALLDAGPNLIDVLATDAITGETVTVTRSITYNP